MSSSQAANHGALHRDRAAGEQLPAHLLQPDGAGATPRLRWRSLEDGIPIEYDEEAVRSGWQRFKADFLSLLPLDQAL